MKNLAYYNGAVGEMSELTVPFSDRACFFGDGVYDATYARNGKIFTLNEHLDRLYFCAERVKIEPPTEKDKLSSLLRSLVTRCDEKEVIVYVQFSRGLSVPRSHAFSGGKSDLWITITPKKITPKEARFRLLSVSDERYSLCYIKTLNLLPNALAATVAHEKGCDEGVFVENGFINECTHSNIHLLKNGMLISPPPGAKVLGGIARKHLLKACRSSSVPVSERHFTVQELLDADEVLVSSAGTLLTPCVSFDGKPVGGKDEQTVFSLQNILYNEFYDETK